VKAGSKYGVLLAVALIAGAAAPGAHAGHGAVQISPDNTQFTGTADDPTFTFGTRVLTCDTSTIQGMTGTDSDILDVDLEFEEPCSIQPTGLGGTWSCNDGEFMRLHVLDATGAGEVDVLLPGFGCHMVVPGLCTISVGPQDLPIPGGVNRADFTEEGIDIEVDVLATNNNSLCGPTPSFIARFTAQYALDTDIDWTPREGV
jgi:hypothetical protein